MKKFPALAALLEVRTSLERLHREGRIAWQADPALIPAFIDLLRALQSTYSVSLQVEVRGCENGQQVEKRLVQLVRLLDLPPFEEVIGTAQELRGDSPALLRLIVEVDPRQRKVRAILTDGLPWFRTAQQARPALLYDGPCKDPALQVVWRFLRWYRAELERIRALPPGRSQSRWEVLERQLVYLWATPDFDRLPAQAADLWVQDVLRLSVLRLLRGIPSAAMQGAPEEVRMFPLGYQVLRMDLHGQLPLELVSLRDGAELVRVRTRPQPVYVDRWEVSRGQYLRFLLFEGERGDGSSVPIEGALDSAIDRVSWFDAVAYLQWAGRGLPTASDWRAASRGAVALAKRGRSTVPVQVPDDVAASGCINLLGGVAEWLADPRAPSREEDRSAHRLAIVPGSPGVAQLQMFPAEAHVKNLGFRGALVVPLQPGNETLGAVHLGRNPGTRLGARFFLGNGGYLRR